MASNFDRYVFTSIRRRLPPHLRSLRDFYFYTLSITGLFCLLLLLPVLVLTDQQILTAVALSCGALLSLTLALWRLGVSLTWIQFFYPPIVIGGICFSAYHTGGIMSPVMMSIGMAPSLALFTVSRRGRYAWLLLTALSLTFLWWAQRHGRVMPQNPSSSQTLILGASMIALLCIAHVALFILYDAANAQSIRTIALKSRALNNLSHDLQLTHIHKARFLSTVSHEIRTPLNAVMGYLGLLRNDPHSASINASYIEGAQSAAAQLMTVISDLVDYSHIQQGRLALSYQTVHLPQLISNAFETLAPQASHLHIHYALHLDPNLPTWIHTDPHRLEQIFTNLLGNALKFTPNGSVIAHILLKVDPQTSAPKLLVIQVNDSGIGIPEQAMQKIFEPFFQLQPAPTLGTGNALRGNGLGLAITQRLVERLGGVIHVSSQEGIGSCFEVQLPLKISADRPSEPSPPKDINLLIVDDHATNRLVAAATIKQDLPRTRIDEARNGTEALAKMKAHCYDLVLMDLLMPDFSGIEVVRRIRAECAAPHRHVKVIALTAYVSDEALHQCQEVGIDVLLPKPFDRAILIQTVLQQTA